MPPSQQNKLCAEILQIAYYSQNLFNPFYSWQDCGELIDKLEGDGYLVSHSENLAKCSHADSETFDAWSKQGGKAGIVDCFIQIYGDKE